MSHSPSSSLPTEYLILRQPSHLYENRYELLSPNMGPVSSLRLRMWQFVQQRPSRKSIFIILCINTLLLLAFLSWLAILTAFLHRLSRLPMSSNGISRIIDNITSSRVSPYYGLREFHPFPSDFTRGILPISCHSHNDYLRDNPLLDAIYAGCTSVEADIWVAGRNSKTTNASELYVGHSARSLEPDSTLRLLYLDPLHFILDQLNRNIQKEETLRQERQQVVGIFSTDPNMTLVLLLDFKESVLETDIWTLVQEHLQPLRTKGYLTRWDKVANKRIMGPITIVASGDAPFDLITDIKTNQFQDIFFDAPLEKLYSNSSMGSPIYTAENSYYASTSLSKAVGKVWFDFTPAQLITITQQTERAREGKLLSRYWSTPSWPVNTRNRIWERLINNGVGVLNVDELWTASRRDWRLCWYIGWGICP